MRIKYHEKQRTWRSFNVLQTDYESFAIVHSCRDNFGWQKQEYVWVLTRQPLDQYDYDDEFEYDRIRYLAQDILVDNFPDLDLEYEMQSVV